MIKYPNRTGQSGTFHVSTPDYVDVATGAATLGMVTYTAKATDDAWADGDVLGLLVKEDDSNYQVWTATWDATNEYLLATIVEEEVGTLTDNGTVTVTAVLTEKVFSQQVQAGQFVEETTAARALAIGDIGQVICCTNGSATVVTCDDALPVGFHVLVVQEGLGEVSIDIEGTDTLNGGTDPVVLAGQYKSAYVYQRATGEWIAVV